jgi:hypothetical protein
MQADQTDDLERTVTDSSQLTVLSTAWLTEM